MTAPESVSELLGLDIPAELRPYLDPADPAPRTDTPRTDAPRTDEPSEGADTRQELERELTQGMLTETEHWLGVWVPRTVSRVLTSAFVVARARRPPVRRDPRSQQKGPADP